MKGRNWNEDEVTLALGLYLITPYSKIDKKNLRIAMLAKLLGRTANSVSMKLGNLADLDPEVARKGRKGLKNGSRMDKRVWDDFFDPATGSIMTASLREEIEKIVARDPCLSLDFLDADPDAIKAGKTSGVLQKAAPPPLVMMKIDGVEQLVTRKERLHQDYFRRAVLANCEQQCVISHFSETSLIEAAHILPWSECREARLEVGNGLALNALLHAAFDENLLGISPDGVVKVSDALIRKSGGFHPIFSEINGARLDSTLMRQPPRRDFLDLRYQKFLASQ